MLRPSESPQAIILDRHKKECFLSYIVADGLEKRWPSGFVIKMCLTLEKGMESSQEVENGSLFSYTFSYTFLSQHCIHFPN